MRLGKRRRERNATSQSDTEPQKENEAPVFNKEEVPAESDTVHTEETSDEEELGRFEKKRIERLNSYNPDKVRSKRNGDKPPIPLGITGDTDIANTFRAIVKIRKKQINEVLSTILDEYNKENYKFLKYGQEG